MYVVTANLINCGRPARKVHMHAQIVICTLPRHTRGALGIYTSHSYTVSCSELCDLIGVKKFQDRYTHVQDVHDSPDPL